MQAMILTDHTGDSSEKQGLTPCDACRLWLQVLLELWALAGLWLFSCWSQNPWRTVNWSLQQLLLTGQWNWTFGCLLGYPRLGVSGQEHCPVPPLLLAWQHLGEQAEAGGRNLFSYASMNWQSLGFQARSHMSSLILRAGIAPLIQCIQSNWIMKQK